MSDPHTWHEADAILTRNGKPVPTRKIANHTYLQRRPKDAIAVKFHDTDVVTYTRTGDLVLDSGGWLTMATKDRINRYAPKAVRVWSESGRWMVTVQVKGSSHYEYGQRITTPDYDLSVPFCDGLILEHWADDYTQFRPMNRPSPRKVQQEDAHNKRVEKLLDAWLRGLTPELVAIVTSKGGNYRQYAKGPTGDVYDEGGNRISVTHTPHEGCAMCVRTSVGVLVGDSFEDVHHLIEHLEDKVYPYNLLLVASEQFNDSGMRCTIPALCKRDVRAYLRQKLYTGSVALAHGKRPRFAPPRSLERTHR